MIEIGRYQRLEVVKRVGFGLFLGTGEESVLLPKKYAPRGARVGDVLRVFVYQDSEARPIATTQTPLAAVGEIAPMTVVEVSSHGAFLDWGLEKDLFVPTAEQHRRMVVGSTHVVEVCIDERNGRLIGSSLLGSFFDYEVGHLAAGKEVDLLVYGFNDVGAQVVVDGRYSGLVYKSEIFNPVHVGESLRGYIDLVRDDNKLDVRLRKPGRAAELAAESTILGMLEDSDDGFLSLHDKSPPAEIGRRLDMSKRVFKAAIGGLFRRGLIDLRADGIRLRRG